MYMHADCDNYLLTRPDGPAEMHRAWREPQTDTRLFTVFACALQTWGRDRPQPIVRPGNDLQSERR